MRKICLSLLLVTLLFAHLTLAEVEVEDDVLVLTDNNFDEELKKHDFLLVEFYAPWCGHCKSLAPEYAKAAKRLKENNPPYYIAKVDATEQKAVAQRFGIKGFPTLFFFKYGNKNEYNGGRTENEIVSWILKKVGPPTQEVTCDELKDKVENKKLVLAYFGEKDDKKFNIFQELANHGSVAEKFEFFQVHDQECGKKNGVTEWPGVALFRKFDEPSLTYTGSWEVTPIVDFMLASSVPTLISFTEEYIEPIFGQKNPALFLFSGKDDAEKPFAKVFEEAAKAFKGMIYFVKSGVHDGIQQRLAEFVGVEEAHLPTLRILDPADGMKKFVFSDGHVNELTVDKIKQFVQDFKDKKLAPFLKSQDPPENNNEGVRVIVGKEFNKIVNDKDADVFVKYYAPWCGHCKKLAPIWDELAADLKDVKGLVIGKFDATANEVDGVEIRGYPTLKFYPKGDNKQPIDYDGERDLENFKKWLKDNSPNYRKHLESKSEL